MAPHVDPVEALCRRLGPAIFRRCLKILRNADDAADASQKVFEQILRHRRALPKEDEQLRWVYVIATNVCLMRLRHHSSRASPQDDDEPSTAATDPFVALANRQMVQKALEEADESERQVAWLVLVDGHTQEEAAELLGISRKTLGKRLQIFVAAARRVLQRVGQP